MDLSYALIKATPFKMQIMEKADQVEIGCNKYKIFLGATSSWYDVIIIILNHWESDFCNFVFDLLYEISNLVVGHNFYLDAVKPY